MARIVVVGAGMGAMAAAARLAVAGQRVTVIERGPTYGGAVHRRERAGFGFDTGPGLLHLPAVWRDLFLKTGRESLEECVELRQIDPAVEHRYADGTVLRLPGFSQGGIRQALDAALGDGAGERWAGLLRRARQTWEATRRPLVEEPLTSSAQREELGRERYPALRRGPWRRRPPTLADVARAELRDPRLGALLAGTVVEYGVDPRTAPAGAVVLPYVEQTFGSWYPVGGMRALATAVYERCRARGVDFVFGAEAVQILQRDGRVAGVQLSSGAQHPADSVVWSTAGVGQRPAGSSRFTVLLALRGGRPAEAAHRTTLLPRDPWGDPLEHPVVRVHRPDDAALRPGPDDEAVVLSALVPPQGVKDWTAGGVAEEFADRLLTRADESGLGLRERVRWREIRTPAEVAADTGVPGGVVAAPALAGAGGEFLAAANSGRLPGAYRAGSLAHPGGGLASTGMSGALVAGLILEGPNWRGSY